MDAEQPGLGSRALLDKIDKLRELGVSSMIPLPQIVAAGEQSAGKSSLLESLTGISFPRSVSLCTRFATEIICRREAQTSVVVTIQPFHSSVSHSSEAAKEHVQRLRAFRRTVGGFTGDEFAEVFKEAAKTMGIKTSPNDTSPAPTFTRDILRIEKSGPTEDNLTLIDVPGIFENESPGITTKQDIVMVKEMVKSYIKDSRTIILAVVPCNTDIATQTIIRLASEADPEGTRTLGVLTKPDLAVETATKNVVADLVRGRRRDLQLGYCLVRNRGADDQSATIDMAARNAAEKAFFQAEPWSGLDTSRVGIPALRARLQELLEDRAKSEFKNVKGEITTKLKEAAKQLDAMGAARVQPDEQRAYLGKIASDFAKLVQFGLDAYYTGDDAMFIKREDLRLITHVRELNEAFAKTLFVNGHATEFELDDSTDEDEDENEDEGEDDEDGDEISPPVSTMFGALDSDTDEQDSKTSSSWSKGRDALYLDPISFKIPTDGEDDLHDIVVDPFECSKPSKAPILDQIEKMYKSYRGYELGTFGPDIIPTTFRVQAAKWESATLAHVSNVILIVHHFILALVEETCPDKVVQSELRSFILERLTACYERAMSHARFLINVELRGKAVTCLPMFDDAVDQIASKRWTRQVEHDAVEIPATVKGVRPGKHIHIDDINRAKNGSGSFGGGARGGNNVNKTTVCERIHDVMKQYYEVVRSRFVDNICVQAVDHYLLSGDASPLNVFGPACVLNMSISQLDSIACEDAASRNRRAALRERIELLEKAVEILRR